jgi:VWFA-related protein
MPRSTADPTLGSPCAARTRWLAGALCALFVSGSSSSGGQATQPPTFRARVELVHLDVRVTDEGGEPVEDLRADEIEILEHGRPRPVRIFQHVHEPREEYAAVARRTIAAEVSTNRGAPRGHLYVLVFDQQHIAPGNEQRARLAAERFLRARLRPADRVAVHAIPGPGPHLPFTNNVEAAVAELTKLRGSLERIGQGALGAMRLYEAYEIVRGNLVILDRVADRLASQSSTSDVIGPLGTLTATGSSPNNSTFQSLVADEARRIVARADQDARALLLNLADLIRGLRRIDGRKNVLVFSEGFFADHLTRELEQVAAAAAESYSVIYAVDLNRRELDLKESEPLGGEQHDEIQSRLASLGSLASETAGELLVDAGGRLDQILTRLADSAQDYYLVGFEPPEEALRDRRRYRRVTVRVRREGVRVSTRTGYALHDEATPADRRRAIDAALAAPFTQQGFAVEYTTYLLRGSAPGRHRIVLSLSAELPVAADRAPSEHADVVFAVRSLAEGRIVASGTDRIPVPAPAHPGETTGPARYRVQFELPAGDYLMRVVVREPGGQIGSADRYLRVPSLYGPGVAAGDLLIRSPHTGSFPVRAAFYPPDVLTGVLELYAPTVADLDDVAVRVEVGGQGATPERRSVSAMLLEPTDTPVGPQRVATFEVPLDGAAPGRYLVRASVERRGQRIAELVRQIDILDGTPPAGDAVVSPTTDSNSPGSATETFDPQALLGGEVARTFLVALRDRADTDLLRRAAELALGGAWSAVETTLGTPGADTPPLAWMLCGVARLAAREYRTAADYLKRGFEANPTDARAAFLLGWAAMAAGDVRQAASAWRSAAFLEPTLVPAHLALADAYVKLAQPALAVQAVRAGLAALPESPELLDRLAQLQGR